jgi:ADP-heptose:LPS heptosyltransferase
VALFQERTLSNRFGVRSSIVARALVRRVGSLPRARPETPGRILVVHQLLLGDTLMLAALLAKLHYRFPQSEIEMALPAAYHPLFQGRPYAVRTHPFSLHDRDQMRALFRLPAFDMAIVPGENRHSWLAQALGARWIVAFAGDRPGHKSWMVDELVEMPAVPMAWGDMAATLMPGPPPAPYSRSDWPSPDAVEFELPQRPYCVLHVGASSQRKLWPAAQWRLAAQSLAERGYAIAWSAGRGEEALVAECDPGSSHKSYAGALNLAQLWHLIQNASLLVAPDTGVAHLGKLTDTPTVALFGRGPTRLYGAGDFWCNAPFYPIVLDDLPARNQHSLFRRTPAWLAGDGGPLAQCAEPRARYGSGMACVESAIETALVAKAGCR